MPGPARRRPKHRSCVRVRTSDQGLPRARCPCQKSTVCSKAVSDTEGARSFFVFKLHSMPFMRDELMAAVADIMTPARATEGVVEFDSARVLRDPDSFIATAIYEGRRSRTTEFTSG